MYTTVDFKTKKALREAVKSGMQCTIYAPGLGASAWDGPETLEGPHYPSPHTWYAQVEMKNGVIVKVR